MSVFVITECGGVENGGKIITLQSLNEWDINFIFPMVVVATNMKLGFETKYGDFCNFCKNVFLNGPRFQIWHPKIVPSAKFKPNWR